MGQQQLLLLVLSTVIVGLATVAGIQAFSENQQQATQDALTQRAMSLGTDIAAAGREPTQMGGVDLNGDAGSSDIADAIGVSDGGAIPAEGAGQDAQCKITSTGSYPVQVKCDDDAGGSGSYGSGQTVTVDVDLTADEQVKVSDITVTS
mgnify:CR=1 FL=1